MRKLQSLAISVFIFLALFQLSVQPIFAQATGKPWSGVCVGGYYSAEAADVATIQGVECLLGNIFTVFFAVIGFAALVMVVVGAMYILLSGGNSKNVETGKKTITFAIIGIVLSLTGFIIINLLSSFIGVNLLQLNIPRADDTLANCKSPSACTTAAACSASGGNPSGQCSPTLVCCRMN